MGKDEREVQGLRKPVESVLHAPFEQEDLAEMLSNLLKSTPDGSEDFLFAHRHLAELTVANEPWKAALSARKLIAFDRYNDQNWALLALALTYLSHFHAAARAYRRAIALAPLNPTYAHNLGHILDIALDQPQDGLPLLASAYRMEPENNEFASSYAHALGRVGMLGEARELLHRSIESGGNQEQHALLAWLEDPTSEHLPNAQHRSTRTSARSVVSHHLNDRRHGEDPNDRNE